MGNDVICLSLSLSCVQGSLPRNFRDCPASNIVLVYTRSRLAGQKRVRLPLLLSLPLALLRTHKVNCKKKKEEEEEDVARHWPASRQGKKLILHPRSSVYNWWPGKDRPSMANTRPVRGKSSLFVRPAALEDKVAGNVIFICYDLTNSPITGNAKR